MLRRFRSPRLVAVTALMLAAVSLTPLIADARPGGGGGGGGGRGGGGGGGASRGGGGGGMSASRGGGGGGGYRSSAPTSVQRGGGDRGGANRGDGNRNVANRGDVNRGDVNRGSGNRGNGNNIHGGNTNINVNNVNNVNGGGYDRGYGAYDNYHPVARGMAVGAAVAVTAAAVGSMMYSLPPACNPYAGSYYYCGGVYYAPQYQGDQVVYVVVDKPG